MSDRSSECIELLRKRQEAFRSLANEIDAGQQACVRLDIEALRSHDSRKITICAELRRLEAAIASLNPARTAMLPETQEEIRRLLVNSEEARTETAKRNQVYEQFLIKARFTIHMMMNVMSHCRGSYPARFHAFTGSLAERGL